MKQKAIKKIKYLFIFLKNYARVVLIILKKSYEFKFTGIFEPKTTQEQIFTKLGQKVINDSLEGYNSTFFLLWTNGLGKNKHNVLK